MNNAVRRGEIKIKKGASLKDLIGYGLLAFLIGLILGFCFG